jgi:hypothetical protein
LNESVTKDGGLAHKRLSSVHDVHVPLCLALLRFNGVKYKYHHEITRQEPRRWRMCPA